MADKQKRIEKTRQGYEVLVPKRGEFFRNLKKIAGKASTVRSKKK